MLPLITPNGSEIAASLNESAEKSYARSIRHINKVIYCIILNGDIKMLGKLRISVITPMFYVFVSKNNFILFLFIYLF